MNEDDLRQIEIGLALALPANYRELALDPPFPTPEHDWMHWFFTDPNDVLHETRNPLAGNCPPEKIPKLHFAFGETAFGDIYVLNSQLCDSPVYCLSHETHSLDTHYPSLNDYVRDWLAPCAEPSVKPKAAFFRRIVRCLKRRLK